MPELSESGTAANPPQEAQAAEEGLFRPGEDDEVQGAPVQTSAIKLKLVRAGSAFARSARNGMNYAHTGAQTLQNQAHVVAGTPAGRGFRHAAKRIARLLLSTRPNGTLEVRQSPVHIYLVLLALLPITYPLIQGFIPDSVNIFADDGPSQILNAEQIALLENYATNDVGTACLLYLYRQTGGFEAMIHRFQTMQGHFDYAFNGYMMLGVAFDMGRHLLEVVQDCFAQLANNPSPAAFLSTLGRSLIMRRSFTRPVFTTPEAQSLLGSGRQANYLAAPQGETNQNNLIRHVINYALGLRMPTRAVTSLVIYLIYSGVAEVAEQLSETLSAEKAGSVEIGPNNQTLAQMAAASFTPVEVTEALEQLMRLLLVFTNLSAWRWDNAFCLAFYLITASYLASTVASMFDQSKKETEERYLPGPGPAPAAAEQ